MRVDLTKLVFRYASKMLANRLTTVHIEYICDTPIKLMNITYWRKDYDGILHSYILLESEADGRLIEASNTNSLCELNDYITGLRIRIVQWHEVRVDETVGRDQLPIAA